MSSPVGAVAAPPAFLSGYARLLSRPDVRRLVAGSMVARLPSAMLPLAILLLVDGRTGSLAAAGLVVGLYGLGRAIVSPLVGALIDRHGQTGVLLTGAVVQAVLLLFLVAAVAIQPALLLIAVIGTVAGAATPPVQASQRALWPLVASGDADRESAYSFDATSQEMIWIVGPLLVAALLLAMPAAVVIILCAFVGIAGVALYASSPVSRAWRSSRQRGRYWPTALARASMRTLVATSTFAGITYGALTFGLTALAVNLGSGRSSGLLLAGVSVGSIAGGLLYGGRAWHTPVLRRYRLLLIATFACGVPLLVAGSIVVALPMSVLAGLPLAPVYACSYWLTGRVAADGRTTEAFTWTSSAFGLGVALGNSGGGVVSQAIDVHAAFALACAASVIAALFAYWVREPAAAAASSSSGPAPAP